MSTVLLETEEAEPFVALVQYVGKRIDEKENAVQTALADTTGNNLSSQAQQMLQSGDIVGVIKALLPHIDIMLAPAEDNSTDACLALLIQLLIRACEDPAATTVTDEFISSLCSTTQVQPYARLSAMLELFNSWPRPQYQHKILLKILDYAHKGKLSQLAVPLYGRADLWDRQWQLSQTQSMDLFEGIAKVLDMHPSAVLKKEAFGLQSRVLLACPKDDANRIQSLKPTARAAALAFIGNPSQFSCDIFNTAPVQALKSDSDSGKVFKLLDMLLNGKLEEFNSEELAPVIEEAQTTESEVLNKMRLMALLAICGTKEGQNVTFKEIEDALQLEKDQAEGWLVQAFGKQLLDGRINQVEECVSVRRCERRVFSEPDWTKLLSDLGAWKKGLEGLDLAMKGKNLLTPSVTVHPWLSA